jgi:1-phosphatidylinositol-3-phosphate 5-kinase
MENLTEGFDDFDTFDLKGSLRNRWLEASGVQLDTNYRRSRIENRVVLGYEDKRKFVRQVTSDSKFLASHRVMDYSLVAIVSRGNSKVRLGIVDYCRSFTIDKALESMVKKTPLYADHNVAPTVISPNEYQERFIKAMEDYFYVSPSYGDLVT